MADLSITASTADPNATFVTYDLGRPNWETPWLPNFLTGQGRVFFPESKRVDVILLGDGFQTRAEFEVMLGDWLKAFFDLEVYDTLRGAFRVRAVFRRSTNRVNLKQTSYYRLLPTDDGVNLSDAGGWYNGSAAAGRGFRAQLQADLALLGFNEQRYPADLDVGGDDAVIHDELANMLSNTVVCMAAFTATLAGAFGHTRRVTLDSGAVLNVAFGADPIHELGHAFAYLEDEYIKGREVQATRTNPPSKSLFTMSNLSFSDALSEVPWAHLSPWGDRPRQAAGGEPSPVVGWAWLGGEVGLGVYHSEYKCMMNGGHDNYRFTTDEATDPTAGADGTYDGKSGAGLRPKPNRFCLWCQEIVVARVLEKTGRLAQAGDPSDPNALGRALYERWVSTWRARYWRLFGVDQQLADREALYADMNNFPTLQMLGLELWQSTLYAPLSSDPLKSGLASSDEDDLELLMVFG